MRSNCVINREGLVFVDQMFLRFLGANNENSTLRALIVCVCVRPCVEEFVKRQSRMGVGGKKGKNGGQGCLDGSVRSSRGCETEGGGGVGKKPNESPVIYTFIFSCSGGCEWELSSMHPGRSPLLVFGERGQSPGPRVWH